MLWELAGTAGCNGGALPGWNCACAELAICWVSLVIVRLLFDQLLDHKGVCLQQYVAMRIGQHVPDGHEVTIDVLFPAAS